MNGNMSFTLLGSHGSVRVHVGCSVPVHVRGFGSRFEHEREPRKEHREA
jgi:hypothetical protein